jgi:hypothetical protein
MRRFIFGVLAALVLSAAVAIAIPLSPGQSIAPGPVRILGTWHGFGGFGGDNTSTTITVSSANTWYPITNGTDNLWVLSEGSGVTITTDNIVISNKGDYVGSVSITLSGTNTHDIFLRAFDLTDNVITGRAVGVTVTGTSNYQTVSMPLYFEVDIQAAHTFQFQVENITSAGDVIVRSAIFEIHYLHE